MVQTCCSSRLSWSTWHRIASTRTPRSFSTELLSRSAPTLYCSMGLFFPRCRSLHLPLFNFRLLFSVHLSSLSRSFWRSQGIQVLATAPSFVSSANLLRRHLPFHSSHWWTSYTILSTVWNLGGHASDKPPAVPLITALLFSQILTDFCQPIQSTLPDFV